MIQANMILLEKHYLSGDPNRFKCVEAYTIARQAEARGFKENHISSFPEQKAILANMDMKEKLPLQNHISSFEEQKTILPIWT